MGDQLLLIAGFEGDDDDEDDHPWEVYGEACPNCGGHHFWVEDFHSDHPGMSITRYTCADCGYEEEVAHE